MPEGLYYSPSATGNETVSTGINDCKCIENVKWSDNTAGSSGKSATCSLNGDQISASWVVAGGKTCTRNYPYENSFINYNPK